MTVAAGDVKGDDRRVDAGWGGVDQFYAGEFGEAELEKVFQFSFVSLYGFEI
mgnify:CR=1 FL=1